MSLLLVWIQQSSLFNNEIWIGSLKESNGQDAKDMEILPWGWTEKVCWQETPGRLHLLWNQLKQMPVVDDSDQWQKDMEVKCQGLHHGCWGQRHTRNRHAFLGCWHTFLRCSHAFLCICLEISQQHRGLSRT